jgi:hypothetical protein
VLKRIEVTGGNVKFLDGGPGSYGPAQPHYIEVNLVGDTGGVKPGLLWLHADRTVRVTGRFPSSASPGGVIELDVPAGLDHDAVASLFRAVEEYDVDVPVCLCWPARAGCGRCDLRHITELSDAVIRVGQDLDRRHQAARESIATLMERVVEDHPEDGPRWTGPVEWATTWARAEWLEAGIAASNAWALAQTDRDDVDWYGPHRVLLLLRAVADAAASRAAPPAGLTVTLTAWEKIPAGAYVLWPTRSWEEVGPAGPDPVLAERLARQVGGREYAMPADEMFLTATNPREPGRVRDALRTYGFEPAGIPQTV